MSADARDLDLLVITGAGGMGQAIARRLGAGRRILLADVSAAALDSVEAALREEGFDVRSQVVDVGNPDDIDRLARAAEDLGGFTYLIHTAGLSPAQASPDQIIQVDVVGTAHLLDAFEAVARPGCVAVCIASMSGAMTSLSREDEAVLASTPTSELRGLAVLDPASLDSGYAYSIAKRANQLRVRARASAWGARGARVVSISPGIISTPMGQQELDSPVGEIMRQMIDTSPVPRIGTPSDIAAAAEFLISANASFITGVDLLVDGGVTATILSPPPPAD